MRSFRIGPRGNWVTVAIWHCKYEPDRYLCPCCQPKSVIAPTEIRRMIWEDRQYFRQDDSTGKSRTPSLSKRLYRNIEITRCK